MAAIRWTKEAEIWLKDIYAYISQNNVTAANKVVAEKYKRTPILALFPENPFRITFISTLMLILNSKTLTYLLILNPEPIPESLHRQYRK